MNKEKNPLLDFKWDDNKNEVNETVEIVKPEEEIEDKEGEEDEEEEPDIETEEIIEDEVEVGEENATVFSDFVSDLSEEGIIAIDSDSKINTPTELYDKIENTISDRASAQFGDFITALKESDPLFSEAARFVNKGGSFQKFMDTYKNIDKDLTDEDFENIEITEAVVRKALSDSALDMSDSEIDEQLEIWEDQGKLEDKARMYDRKSKSSIKKKKEELLKATNNNNNADKSREILRSDLSKLTAHKGITFTDKDKKNLEVFMGRPTVKIGNNKYITGMQAAINNVLDNKEDLFLLAKLLHNKFDFTNLQIVEGKQLAKKLKRKSRLSRRISGTTSSVGAGQNVLDRF